MILGYEANIVLIFYGPIRSWAEMIMGRNGHGPKWLWAEMTRNLKFDFFTFLCRSGVLSSLPKMAVGFCPVGGLSSGDLS